MNDQEYEAAWVIAGSLWPDSVAGGSELVSKAWRRSLDRFTLAELGVAFEHLAQTEPKFPTLSALRAALEEIRDRQRVGERMRLPMPKVRPWVEQPVAERVAQFDRAAEDRRQEYRAEFAVFARDYEPWRKEGISEEAWRARTELWIAHVGPAEQRARQLMTGEITGGDGMAQFLERFAATFDPDEPYAGLTT